jgi:urease accessory protein
MMLAGFAAAPLGMHAPFAELAIWSSVVMLGLFAVLGVKAPVSWAVVIAGVFGAFHGHAHGVEASAASLISYAAGFSLATATLHATGVALGLLAKAAIGKVALADAAHTESQRCSR